MSLLSRGYKHWEGKKTRSSEMLKKPGAGSSKQPHCEESLSGRSPTDRFRVKVKEKSSQKQEGGTNKET